MSEAPARPTQQMPHRGIGFEPGRGPNAAALAAIGVGGIAVLALAASRASEPFVLTLMAALATIGVFFLFALAGRHIRLGPADDRSEFFWGIIEADEDGVEITEPTGRVLAVNKSFRALAGMGPLGEVNTVEALLSRGLGGAEALFRLTRAAERGSPLSEDVLLADQPAAAGAVTGRWIRISVKQLIDPAKPQDPPLRLWRLRDITDERLRQTQSIRPLEDRLALYADAPAGLMTVRADGQIAFLDERLAAWLGYAGSAGTPRDQHLTELVADGGAQLILSTRAGFGDIPQRIDLDLIDDAGSRWPATLAIVARADGLTISVLPRSRPADDASDAVVDQHEQRFSRLFQSAPFGIASIDADGCLVNTNTAFVRLLLDSAAERGTRLLDVIGKGDPAIARQIEDSLEAARSGKANIPTLDIVLGPKGKEQTRKLYVNSLPRAKAGREIAILYMLDTTEARTLEHRIAQAQKMEAVGTLAGGIAHDFNNVLTAIIGFSDLLLQTHKPGNPSYAHILSVKSSAIRAAGLVRQLLAFSRRQTLQPKVLQMSDVLTDLSMLLNRLLGEKIELKIVSGRDLWFVRADPTEIERTIINLGVNARDAMLPKGGRLTLRTRNISERDSQKLESQGVARGEYVLIEVEDTGTGMTPEIMAKIFDPFFTTKAVGKGTGLGLASVYGIVKQTGGYILPESTPGVGTIFRLYLPRYHVEPEAESEVSPAAAAAAAKPRQRDLTGSGRLLLVEDEDAVRRFAVAALKSKGYEVLQAADGVEALEVMKANDNRVDLVVSDVIMPEMDGPTLMKELRKIDPELKFIFVSGYPDEAFRNNLDPEADFTFLPKPYSLAEIAAKVKEVIGR